MANGNSRLSETIDNLRERQLQAWHRGERLLVESLASAVTPPLQESELLELIVAEVKLRSQLGETCTTGEYVQRFPQITDALQRLFASHDAIESPSVETHSFIVHAADESQATVEQPQQRSLCDPYEKTILFDQQKPAKKSLPTDVQIPAAISPTLTYISSSGIGVQQKGRYRLDRVLGEGAFGRVYLGFDQELQRQVAIKVPTKARFKKPEDAEAYLAEARTVASLDHPNIVAVYDVGRTDDGSIYVVSRFVDGSTLEDRIKAGRPAERESARLLAIVALALQYAHQKRLIHRDIKPANILIEDSSNTPFVADFGLAIREEDYLKESVIAGTPAYMSPEQARGEGHRLDGRSDIFSMGVILYQLLTAKKPFRGSTVMETLHQVVSLEPLPPREILDAVPSELERICLKALSKRASDRYSTAAEFANDLEQWLKPAVASVRTKASVQVIPKGLRSFDANDADFFLDLLPGQRNRDGLPESVAFWKQRIEQTDPERTFSVGLIYGPSGCGKSSLVKAGLLPHLSKDVVAVYVEATPEETEIRILRGLRKRLPELSEEQGLADTLTAVRRGQGDGRSKTVVIIIDQFEQWLHAHRAEPDAELVNALRQCDGGRLQAIIMVRDDFSVAAARLMRVLDIPIVEGCNFALVDLFDVDHAAKVLTKFGQAFGKLSTTPGNISTDEQQFVSYVSTGLAQDDKVVSVRLSLFAEMIKGKPWTTATLNQVGGTQGIGVNFLEETFSSAQANPNHRRHAIAARDVLRALLPELGTDIKGHMRSDTELQAVSGYQDRPSDFADLLRILDGELRLITPTDPEGDSVKSSSRHSSLTTRYFQLTHDYLVPSLREWLTRKQKETRKGRAELKLEERAALWRSKPENRYLPSLREWISVRRLTDKNKWTEPQRKIMQKAGRLHVLRIAVFAAILLTVTFAFQFVLARQKATSLVESLKTATPDQLTSLIQQADESLQRLDRLLQPLINKADSADIQAGDQAAALAARLVLVRHDSSQIKPLSEALFSGNLAFVDLIRTRLRPHADNLRPQWLQILRDKNESSNRRFRAALGLAGLVFDQTKTQIVWTDTDLQFVALELASGSAEYQPQLRTLLRPIGPELVSALETLFDAETATEDQQINAMMALADYAGDDEELMAKLLMRGTARKTEILSAKVAEFKSERVRQDLANLTSELPDRQLPQRDRILHGRSRANAAITLLRQGEHSVYFDALRIWDDPESLSQFVARCRKWAVTPAELIESLQRSAELCQTAPVETKKIESRVMYGLLLALGSYSVEQIPEGSREALFLLLGKLYEEDPSAAVHSASGWLLRHWGHSRDVQQLEEQAVPYDPTGEREWFRLRLSLTRKSSRLSSNGVGREEKYVHSLTFVVIPAGDHTSSRLVKASNGSNGQSPLESRYVGPGVGFILSRPVALCDREVTWALYDLFDGGEQRKYYSNWITSDEGAACNDDWRMWVEFCNWLTGEWRNGDESWQCYPDVKATNFYDMLPLERGGFRMPTEWEWELGARGGQHTEYAFGGDLGLLGDYDWFLDNSEHYPSATAVKLPTIGGLFDAHGNVSELTHQMLFADDFRLNERKYGVARGGRWNDVAELCRSERRECANDYCKFQDPVGCRLALSLPLDDVPEAQQTK